jgi:hypothetical protein
MEYEALAAWAQPPPPLQAPLPRPRRHRLQGGGAQARRTRGPRGRVATRTIRYAHPWLLFVQT